MIRRLNRDVISGALFIAIGAAGLYISHDYRIGTAFRMGPGYFPRLLCAVLVGLGVLIALRGLVRGGEMPGRLNWRPLVMVTTAIVTFALLISTAGLLPAALAIVLLGAFGGPEFKPVEAVILAVLLSAGAVALFKLGLGMPFPIFAFPIPFL